jgi:phosphoribosylglycinamide formyltransferase-1
MSKKIKLAVLISGTGRTLKNMIDHIKAGTLDAEIKLVVSSSASARGLQYAEEDVIPIAIMERPDFKSQGEFSTAIFDACRKAGVDYVAMAGYIKFLDIPDDFTNRVLNIHPSLVPAFCGKGYYGDHVHAKALEYGVKITGCTVHFVDQKYDNGPVILQKAVEILETDTVASLNDRVFGAEREAYPEALQLLAEDRVSLVGRMVKIAPPPENRVIDF